MKSACASSHNETLTSSLCPVFWALGIACVVLVIWIPQIPAQQLDLSAFYAAALAALALLLGLFFYRMYYDGDMLSVDLLYVIVFNIVHFGMAILLFFAPNSPPGVKADLWIHMNGNFVARAAWLCFASIGLFVAGYNAIPRERASSSIGPIPVTSPLALERARLWYWMGAAIAGASVLMLLYGLSKAGGLGFITQPYAATYARELGGVGRQIVHEADYVLRLGILITLVGWLLWTDRGLPRWYIGLLVALAAFYGLWGKRAGFVMTGLPLFIVYHYLRRRIAPRHIAILGTAAVIIFSFIQSFRGIEGKLSASAGEIAEAAAKTSPMTMLFQASANFALVSRTMAMFPERYPFRDGQSYLFALQYVIPKLGPDLPPLMQRNERQMHMHRFMVKHTLPKQYARDLGWAYTAVGEAYANFGVWGALFFAVVGILLRELLEKARKERSVVWWSVFGVVVVTWFIQTRNDSLILTGQGRMIVIVILCAIFIAALMRFQQFVSARQVPAAQTQGKEQ